MPGADRARPHHQGPGGSTARLTLPGRCADIDNAGPQILDSILEDQLQTRPRGAVIPLPTDVREAAKQLGLV